MRFVEDGHAAQADVAGARVVVDPHDLTTGPAVTGRTSRDRPAGGPPSGPRRWRPRAITATVAVAVGIALVLVTIGGDGAPVGTLGHLDRPPGLVADAPPPPGDLRLAWEVPVAPGPDRGARVGVGAVRAVPGSDAIVVGDLVVDTASGTVSAVAVPGVPLGDGTVARATEAGLSIWDVATGTEAGVRTVDLPSGAVFQPVAALDERTVLGTLRREDATGGRAAWATLARDGTVTVTPQPRRPAGAREGVRAVLDGRFVLLDTGGDRPGVEWVDLVTGATTPFGTADDRGRLTVAAGDQVVRVDGDGLLAFSSSGLVRLPELTTGSSSPLRDLALLGEVDGGLVVAGRRGPDHSWQLAQLPLPIREDTTGRSFAVLPRGTVRAPDESTARSGLGIRRPGDAAVVGDLVVVLDQLPGASRLVALDLDGRRVWSRPEDGDSSIVGVAGHVVVLEEGGIGQRVTLRDGADGRVRSTTVVAGHLEPRFRWVLDGVVGTLTSAGVVDARTGAPAGRRELPPGEILAVVPDRVDREPSLLVDAGAGRFLLGGTSVAPVAEADGGARVRVIGWDRGGSAFEVYEYDAPGGGTRRWIAVTTTDGDVVRHDGLVDAGWWSQSTVGRVLAGSDGDDLVLLDPGTGGVGVRVDGAVVATRASADRLVVAGRSSWWIVDASDGTSVGGPRPTTGSLPSVGDGLVVWARPDGALEVVDAADGATRWVVADAAVAPTVVVLAGEHALVGTREGVLLEYDGEGTLVRELVVGDGPVQGVAWAAGTLVVDVDGVLRGFRAGGAGGPVEARVVVP